MVHCLSSQYDLCLCLDGQMLGVEQGAAEKMQHPRNISLKVALVSVRTDRTAQNSYGHPKILYCIIASRINSY